MSTSSLKRSMNEVLSSQIATLDFPEKYHLRVVADKADPQTVSAVVVGSGETVHLTWHNIMTSADIRQIRLERTDDGRPCINLISMDASIKKLNHWNKVEQGKRIAVIIDGAVHFVAPISVQSGRHYRFGAGLDSDELDRLIRLMKHEWSDSSG